MSPMTSDISPPNRLGRGLDVYLRDINATALLSREDERALSTQIAAGDRVARDHLVRANLRLVVSIARGAHSGGLSIEDMIAEGNLGLMRAVEGFDGDMDVRFSTYSSYWIKQAIRGAVINQGQLIRTPKYVVSLLAKWRKVTASLSEGLGREPTPEEVGKALELSQKQLGIAIQALHVKKVMCSPEPSNEGQNGLRDVPGDRGRDAADLLSDTDDLDTVFRGLDGLDERKATVIRMRFGLDERAPMTLEDVGEQLGLTHERIRQLEKEALQQLRKVARFERTSDSLPNQFAHE
jgi:RNA polymerase primary sigma factor